MLNNQCPWDQYEPATRHFCEAELCQWITKPAESWSNIGFVLIGAYLIHKASKSNRKNLSLVGICSILVGIGSFIFHATATRWGQVLDVSAMMWLLSLPLVLNGARLKVLKDSQVKMAYALFSLLSTVFITFFTKWGIAYFGVFVAVGVFSELKLFLNKANKVNYKPYIKLLVTFFVALGIWITDTFKIICDPNNHIFNGHAAWHLLCALAVYYIYEFYSQFPENKLES
ncbi:MAG: ceramidase domain-containing protein [Bacteriovoracaceae bacterium]|nr:ceramidase domain-containing protein [Bacteriovoracaceae bacterium]